MLLVMNIWYITNLPAPYTVEFFERLGRRCELQVIYERRSASDRDLKWKTEVNNDKPYSERYINNIDIGGENSIGLGLIRFLKRELKRNCPDAIIFGDYGTYSSILAIMFLKKNGVPYIISTDGGFVNHEESWIKSKIKRYLIGGASWWFSSGGLTEDYLTYYGAKKDRITQYPFTSLRKEDILTNCLNKEEKCNIRMRLGLPSGKLLLGVGQFIPRKGWDILLEAFDVLVENNEDISLLIIGGNEDSFEQLVGRSIPKRVHIIPFVIKNELIQYYKCADIFVLPTREDIWGLVINEAMAAGLPIITTDRCNAGIELIENGVNGFIAKADDKDSLLESLNEILRLSDEDIFEMSEAGLKVISEYSFDDMAEAYISGLNLYESKKDTIQ